MKTTHIPSQRLFSFSFVAKEIKSPPKPNTMAEVKSSCRTLLFSTEVSKLAGFELAHFFFTLQLLLVGCKSLQHNSCL